MTNFFWILGFNISKSIPVMKQLIVTESNNFSGSKSERGHSSMRTRRLLAQGDTLIAALNALGNECKVTEVERFRWYKVEVPDDWNQATLRNKIEEYVKTHNNTPLDQFGEESAELKTSMLNGLGVKQP